VQRIQHKCLQLDRTASSSEGNSSWQMAHVWQVQSTS